MIRHLCAFLGVWALICFPVSGQADEFVRLLTEDNIKRFIAETSKVTAGKSRMSEERVVGYLEKHLHDDARFKSTMKYAIPGFPPQENALSLDRDEFIDSVKKSSATVSDYDHDIKITKVRISSDKTKATVMSESFEKGTMNMSETQQVPIEGLSKCHQILMLEDGVIQMYSAQCKTDVRFLDF